MGRPMGDLVKCDGKWEPIPYSLGYFVSDQGLVKYPSGYITAGRPDNKGYLRVEVDFEYTGRITKRVHRLVAEVFCDKNGGEEVNHKDSDKSNNKSTNLEWCSRQQNMEHYYREGNVVVLSGEEHGMAKLTLEDVQHIKALIANGHRSRDISKLYPVTEQMIYRIKKGLAWRDV